MIITILGDKEENRFYEIGKRIESVLENNVEDEVIQVYIERFSEFAYNISKVCNDFKKKHSKTFVYMVSGINCKKQIAFEPYNTYCDGKIYLDMEESSSTNFIDLWMLRQSDLVFTCFQIESEMANAVFNYLLKNKRRYINIGDYELKQIAINNKQPAKKITYQTKYILK